ncbi:MAG: SDR family oxidoreductase [Thermoleophilia bacterium]
MTAPLTGKVAFISGASRGIGLAIALRLARAGAAVAFIAKTAEPHPALPGTVHTAAAEIEAAGGRALAIVGDVRSDEQVAAAVARTVAEFGGVDLVVNNASAIDLSPTEHLSMKRYDLMQDINTRGTFLVSKTCIPHLRRADNPHILTLSPPPDLRPRWFGANLGYALAKYGMSMCTLGLAEELAVDGIAANSLWPRTIIATAAVQNLLGGDVAMAHARRPEIVADAAFEIVRRPSAECTGNFFIDEEVLTDAGVTDFSPYAYSDGAVLQGDIFLEGWLPD